MSAASKLIPQPFETSKMFDVSFQADKPIIVHQGGTSGKTYSLLQVLVMMAIYYPGVVITVVGQDMPNLRKGSYRDIQTIINGSEWIQERIKGHNRSNFEFSFNNESLIEFNSYDDFQDAKNGKRDFLFVNEANGIPYEIFEELNVRTSRKTFIDFNPTARFWAHDKLYGRDDVLWVKSTFMHNPFIEESVRKKIEGYEPTPDNIAAGTANEYRWKVYGLGEVGRLEGLVFPDFKVSSDWPDEFKWEIFGLDFGFTNDPTAIPWIRYAHGELFWRELVYEKGLTNPDVAERWRDIEETSYKEEIVADSAEPKSIRELNDLGMNVIPAEKGTDSIMQGINLILQYQINVHYSSKNLIEEFSSYTWKKDKNGNPMNKPIDAFNHGIDAGRYALMNKMNNKPTSIGGATINF